MPTLRRQDKRGCCILESSIVFTFSGAMSYVGPVKVQSIQPNSDQVWKEVRIIASLRLRSLSNAFSFRGQIWVLDDLMQCGEVGVLSEEGAL